MGDADAYGVIFKPTALLSVYEKAGIVEFAEGLVALGWRILASGGTAAALTRAGVPVTDVAGMVGGGAILGHKVVTLSREVHAGLLADPETDRDEMECLGLPYVQLVCVDLYPLQAEISNPEATQASVIAKTDIGGPTMLRSAAKGRRIVICDPADRPRVLAWLKEGRPNEDEYITVLCAKAEGVVAEYCLASAAYHSRGVITGRVGWRVATCKYGENASQEAELYQTDNSDPLAIPRLQVEGQPPSFVGTTDYQALTEGHAFVAAGYEVNFGEQADCVLVVKHGTFSNGAVAPAGGDRCALMRTAIACDPEAITGGVLMATFPIDEEMAQDLRSYLYTPLPGASKRVMDGALAPAVSPEARKILERVDIGKWRIATNPALAHFSAASLDRSDRFRQVRGGFLKQTAPTHVLDFRHPKLRVTGHLTGQQKRDLVFASALCGVVRSNTVVLVKDGQLLGIGCNQTKRDRAVRVAYMVAEENGLDVRGAVLVSDSFFVEMDGPEHALEQGVSVMYATNRPEPKEDDVKGWERKERVDAILRDLCLKQEVTLVEIPDNVGRKFSGHG